MSATGKLMRSLLAVGLVMVVFAGPATTTPVKRDQVLRVAIASEPPSLDPALATDTTSAHVLENIMYPLVYLGRDANLSPQPGAAKSWTVRGSTVTLRLRKGTRWTNGREVTAHDYVWSWLRAISPGLGADYAYQFYVIRGAEAYNGCDAAKADCRALRSKVGISAKGRYTLVIRLTSPRPWFLQQLAHTSFLPANKEAVRKSGSRWTEASNIVTNGPFRLASWKHDASLTLVRNPTFDPGGNSFVKRSDVKLSKVELAIIPDAATALNSFNAGRTEIVPAVSIPLASVPTMRKTPYWHVYKALGTAYYGFNVKNVRDANQRRAMAFAIDRTAINKYLLQGSWQPARGFTPIAMSGGPTILKKSFLPVTARTDQAKAFMAKVRTPKRSLRLYVSTRPGQLKIAVAIQYYWRQLGLDVTIKTMEWKQFLAFLGPPPNSDVDVYSLGWIADYPDAYNVLSLWTCSSGMNNSTWCNRKFDSIIAKAAKTTSARKRTLLYQRAESMLTGPSGGLPVVPILWFTTGVLQKTYVHGFWVNPTGTILYAKVWLS